MIATGGQPKTLEAFTNIGPDHVTTYHNVQDFMKMEALIGAIHYYVSTCIAKMVFCYQNCSDLLWKKNCSSDREKLLKFQAEGREFAKFLRLLEQFIQTVKGQNNFW